MATIDVDVQLSAPLAVTVNLGQPISIPVTLAPNTIIEVGVVATGRTGDTGATGSAGPPGTTDYNALSNKPTLGTAAATASTDYATAAQADKNYEAVLAGETDITITHNLNKYPAITIFDSAGDEVVGNYKHLSINQAQLLFSAGFGGKAIFN